MRMLSWLRFRHKWLGQKKIWLNFSFYNLRKVFRKSLPSRKTYQNKREYHQLTCFDVSDKNYLDKKKYDTTNIFCFAIWEKIFENFYHPEKRSKIKENIANWLVLLFQTKITGAKNNLTQIFLFLQFF